MYKLFITILLLIVGVFNIKAQIYCGSNLNISLVKENVSNSKLIQSNHYFNINLKYVYKNYQIGLIGGYNNLSILEQGNLEPSLFTDFGMFIGTNISKSLKSKFWISLGINYRIYQDIKLLYSQKGNRLGVILNGTYEKELNKYCNLVITGQIIRDFKSSLVNTRQYLFTSTLYGVGVHVNLKEALNRVKKRDNSH